MPASTPTQNKEFVQRFFDQVVNQRDVDSLPNFMVDDGGTCGGVSIQQMVENPLRPGARLVPAAASRPREGATAMRPDLEALRDFTSHVLSAFPDMLVHIDSIVAEGDTVVVRWSARGTHLGEFMGTPPTRRVIPMRSVDYFTFRDGKIASHEGYPDSARVLARLGQLPLTPIARALAGPDPDDEPDDED
jgi:steroid delta-isomerase-like uncharacterized protein